MTGKPLIKDKKGIAMLEALPIIWVMFVLLGATLGSWGIVHTAVLNSIAARHAIFFYFNHRSDLSYLRDFGNQDYSRLNNLDPKNKKIYFGEMGKRYSFITSEDTDFSSSNPGQRATLRRVDFRKPTYTDRDGFLDASGHNRIHDLVPARNTREKVGPAWIRVGYGICLNYKCGN